MRGFKKDGKFRPTEKTVKGLSKKHFIVKTFDNKYDNRNIITNKINSLITKENTKKLNNNDLKRMIDIVNGIFEKQTVYLENNKGKFDNNLTLSQHEKTLDSLNILIEESSKRKLKE